MMSPSPQALLPKKRDEGERAPVRREGLGALGLHLLFWELGAVGWGGPWALGLLLLSACLIPGAVSAPSPPSLLQPAL